MDIEIDGKAVGRLLFEVQNFLTLPTTVFGLVNSAVFYMVNTIC